MPFSFAILPISLTGLIVPISLFANIIEMRIVLSVMAFRTSSGLTIPNLSTERYVAVALPLPSNDLTVSSTARCSVDAVIIWSPFSLYISSTPLIARLSDSVAPLVKTISFGSALISLAICFRALSTASSAAHPKAWLRLAAFPNFSTK